MAGFVDAVNGITFTPSGAGASVVSGKANNGYRQAQRVSTETPESALITFSPTTDYTICGWVKPISTAGPSTQSAFYVNLFGGSTDSGILVSIRFDNQTIDSGFIGNNDDYQLLTGVSDAGISTIGGGWFFFLAEARSGILGVQINNGTLHTTSSPILFDTDATGFFILETATLGVFTQTHDFDEFAIFKDGLTDLQKAAIYNGGAGVTWPITL